MKKVLLIFLGISFLFFNVTSAVASYKSNCYQVGTYVDSTTPTRGITFTLPSRHLVVSNSASSATVIVCIDSASATTYTLNEEGSFILGVGETLSFPDYVTEGVSIIRYNNRNASGVSVIATY